jgi:hypothetical protein
LILFSGGVVIPAAIAAGQAIVIGVEGAGLLIGVATVLSWFGVALSAGGTADGAKWSEISEEACLIFDVLFAAVLFIFHMFLTAVGAAFTIAMLELGNECTLCR